MSTTTLTGGSPFGVSSDAVVAASCQPRPMSTFAGSRIALQFRHLHERARIIEIAIRPGDASCEKDPPDASPNLDPSPQPIEKEELATQ